MHFIVVTGSGRQRTRLPPACPSWEHTSTGSTAAPPSPESSANPAPGPIPSSRRRGQKRFDRVNVGKPRRSSHFLPRTRGPAQTELAADARDTTVASSPQDLGVERVGEARPGSSPRHLLDAGTAVPAAHPADLGADQGLRVPAVQVMPDSGWPDVVDAVLGLAAARGEFSSAIVTSPRCASTSRISEAPSCRRFSKFARCRATSSRRPRLS